MNGSLLGNMVVGSVSQKRMRHAIFLSLKCQTKTLKFARWSYMRTKGATSNVFVTLRQLNELLNEDAIIPVARRFADQLNLLGKPMYTNDESLKAAGNQPAAEEVIPVREVLPEPEESDAVESPWKEQL